MGLPSQREWVKLAGGGFVAALLGLLVLWAVLAAPARADVTINVNTTTDDTTPGDGLCSLRKAITYADGGTTEIDCAQGMASGTTTINVPAGHYVLTGGTLPITGNAIIRGAGASATSIDANGSSQVIEVFANSGTVTASISGVTVTGGLTPLVGFMVRINGGEGGGIENLATLTLNGVTVTANATDDGRTSPLCFAGGCSGGSGGQGGGIWNAGTLTIDNSTISDNTTGSGASGTAGANNGGGAGGAGGSGGPGGAGGGIYNTGTLTVTDSTISANATGMGGDGGGGGGGTGAAGGSGGSSGAGGPGGGIENVGTLTVADSTIAGNSTGSGGSGGAGGPGASGGEGMDGSNGGSGAGIDSNTGATVNNATITDNTTAGGGAGGVGGGGTPGGGNGANGNGGSGGGFNQSGMGATLTQVTIDANTAAGTGIGGGLNAGGGTISLANSIVASNLGSADANCAGAMISDAGHNLVLGDSSMCPGITGDPKLGALTDNGGPTDTMALQTGSPAVGLVPTNDCPLTTDQRGVSRPQGGACDAGAYELAPPSVGGVTGAGKTTSTATVTASINPNLKDTKVTVDYGPTIGYGSATPTQDLGAGNSPAPFTATLTGVTPNTTYHARVVATNGDGTTTSGDITFTTPPAVSASVVSASATGDRLSLTIACNHGSPSEKCSGPVTLTSHVSTHAGKTIAVAASAKAKPEKKKKPKPKPKAKKVKVAIGSYSVTTGKRVTIRLTLSSTGQKLLDQFYRLPSTVTIGGTTSISKRVTFSYKRISSPISFTWAFSAGSSVAQELTISGLPSKPKVTVICHGGGCPFGTRTFSAHGRQLALAPRLNSSHLTPGATLELEITAANDVGKVAIFTIRSARQPSLIERCLLPGARHPTVCA
jgi:CSLREA domain-containing protein